MIETIELVGCITGLCGSALLAMNNRHSGWGFVLFLVSNMAWIAFGLMSNATGLIVMQVGFTATSLIGVWKWLISPRANLVHKKCGQVCE